MSIKDNITELSDDKYLVHFGKWNRTHPEAFRIAFDVSEEYGGNVAIGWHNQIGWYVLHDQGYGIGLVWNEKDATGTVKERLSLVPKVEARSTPIKFPWSKTSSSEEEEGDATASHKKNETIEGAETKEVREEEGQGS